MKETARKHSVVSRSHDHSTNPQDPHHHYLNYEQLFTRLNTIGEDISDEHLDRILALTERGMDLTQKAKMLSVILEEISQNNSQLTLE